MVSSNTKLFGTINVFNRFKIGEGVQRHGTCRCSPRHRPWTGSSTDDISMFTGEVGRELTDDEYAEIMTGYTP